MLCENTQLKFWSFKCKLSQETSRIVELYGIQALSIVLWFQTFLKSANFELVTQAHRAFFCFELHVVLRILMSHHFHFRVTTFQAVERKNSVMAFTLVLGGHLDLKFNLEFNRIAMAADFVWKCIEFINAIFTFQSKNCETFFISKLILGPSDDAMSKWFCC